MAAVWIAGLLVFWVVGELLARRRRARRERREAQRAAGALRVLDYDLQRAREGKTGFVASTAFGDLVWGFGLLFAVAVSAPMFLEGNPIQRGIRTVLLIVGLGGGLWAARLGARVDRLSDLLEAVGLFDKVGAGKPPPENRLTRIARTWVLRLGTLVTIFAGQLSVGVAFFYVQGTLVLRQYTEPVLSYAPDVIAAGVGLVGVGLGLRALAFVGRLKSAGPRPRGI